ncbi:Ankyrin Repeat [Mactra antiquata]
MDLKERNIYEAASNNDIDTLKEALAGKHGEPRKEDLELALFRSSTFGHIECVNLLLDFKVNINAHNGSEDTPIMLAAHSGHANVVTRLIERGANIHDQNCMGYTALMKACENGQVETVELLLKHGANITQHEVPPEEHNALPNGSAKNLLPKFMPHGYTALMVLVLKQPDNYKTLLKMLLDANMPVNEIDLEETTVLLHAANKCPPDVIEMLLLAGAAVNAVDTWGVTALMQASAYNKVENVQVLLKYGANVLITCKAKRTALSIATRTGPEELIKALLEAGADMNQKDAHGRTPLFISISHVNYAGLKCLIQAGCDLTVMCREVTTFQFMNCFECALHRKDSNMVETLYQAGACTNKKIFDIFSDEKFKEQFADVPEIIEFFNKVVSTPRSLRSNCRMIIRDCVRKPLPISVASLNLPASLKDYLLFKDIHIPQ